MALKLKKLPNYQSEDDDSDDENQRETGRKVNSKSQKWVLVKSFQSEHDACEYAKSIGFTKRSTNPADEKTGRKVKYF